FVFVLSLLGSLFVASLLQYLPKQGSHGIGMAAWQTMGEAWPQGWAFFAREASTPIYVVARPDASGSWVTPTSSRQLSAQTYYGLSLDASSELVEATLLAERVPSNGWTTCSANG